MAAFAFILNPIDERLKMGIKNNNGHNKSEIILILMSPKKRDTCRIVKQRMKVLPKANGVW